MKALLSLAALALFTSVQPSPDAAARPTFTVLYTGSRVGELNPCGCAKHPMGGLARHLQAVANARKDGPVLALDGGDALLKEVPIPTPLRQQYGAKAEVVAAAYGRSLDAFVPGELDVGDNARWMLDLLRRHRVPVVAANLVDADGKQVFPASLVKDVGGQRVLVVGVVDPSLWPAGLSLRAVPAIPAMLAALQDAPAHDVAVLLAHANLETASTYSRAAGVFTLVSAGHGGALFFHPKEIEAAPGARVARALALSSGKTAKYVAQLRVSLRPGEVALRGGEAYGRVRIALDTAHKKLVANPADAAARQSVTELEARVADDNAHSHADWDLLGMETEAPEEPVVASWVATYNARNAEREKALLGDSAPQVELPEKSPFVGVKACISCHQDQYEAWLRTPHARAMATLRNKHQELDRECVGCHSMGFKQAGGYQDPVNVGGFGDVQCEACHGPGRLHAEDSSRSSIRRATGQATCTRCHTPENAPQFVFGSHREKIRHWKAP